MKTSIGRVHIKHEKYIYKLNKKDKVLLCPYSNTGRGKPIIFADKNQKFFTISLRPARSVDRKNGFLKKGTKEHKVMWYYDSMEPEGAEPLRLPLLPVLQERLKHGEIKKTGGDGMAADTGEKGEIGQYVTKDAIAQLFEVTGR